MVIGSLLKSSFIDYPDRISSVLFARGCNFRCPYCHNSQLLEEGGQNLTGREIDSFLEKRLRYLDGLVISGGEPTLQPDLPDFMRHLKETTGLPLKLDTNGTRPGVLRQLISSGLADYVAMDVKASPERYQEACGRLVNISDIRQSIKLLMESGIDYEFRTTVARELLTGTDLLELIREIEGARLYVLQSYQDNDEVIIGPGKLSAYTPEEMEEFREELKPYVENIAVRT